MHAVGRLGSYISRGVYTVSGPFHPFGGAVDIIVVEQPDGSFKSSPWYVRFGKFQGVLKTREKVVDINVNGADVNFHMFLDHKGEAYFLREVDGEDGESESESVPFPFSSGDEMDEPLSANRRPMKSKSLNYAADKSNSVVQVDASNGKIMARTSSRRSRIFGFVFGQRSRKEDGYGEKAGGAEIKRLSSLERAEIAADLLEMKWSTSLTTSRLNKKASRFSSNDAFDRKGAEEDKQINTKDNEFHSSVQEKEENSIDNRRSPDETEICDQQKVSSSHYGLDSLDCSVEEASKQVPFVSTEQQVGETSLAGEGLLEEKCNVVSNISGTIEECSVGNPDENETVVPSGVSAPYMQSQYVVEAFGNQQIDEEIADSEMNAILLPGCSISSEETVSDRVQSFIYSETSDSSVVTLDGINEQTHETVCVSDAGNGKVHIHAETLVTATEPVPEVSVLKQTENTDLESEGASTVSESYSQVLGIDPVIGAVEEIKSHCIHTPSTVSGLCDQVEDKKKTKDILHFPLESIGDSKCFTVTEPVPKVIVLRQAEDIELDSEGSLTVSESYSEVVNVDPLIGSMEEIQSHSSHNSFAVSALCDQVEDEKNLKDALCSSLEYVGGSKNLYGDSSPKRSLQPSESSEDEQFLFSDLNESKISESHCVNKDLHPSICTENEKLNGLCNNESYSNSIKFEQENSSNDIESSVENSKFVSGPISICRNNNEHGEKTRLKVELLPNMWSPVAMNQQSLSRSLDSKSETLKWASIRKDDSSCIRSDADEERPAHTRTSSEDSETTVLKSALYNPAVEISLCKHLLYEGMGAESASQVFDAEKLDGKKFSTLGPTVVKNDRLVVRISGRYFPWDAAVPIILGMVAFGNEEIIKLKGMIRVDRVEKTIEGGPSIAIVSRSGSWRLWPFSFRRSRSMNAVQPAPVDTRGSDDVNTVEKTVVSGDDKIFLKAKRVKKMIRSLTPTSEQLASLNLKDGMNHVKFTFSTPMLGKQQVDARIYRWKWNTRIVISDVDGTITRSDVLGQFMPLVGIDWSQTGVAHLFSAIKENGYELIFLSARAISQAYITRQFLLNLKQDGKALPDGPIVISPDGLFPSLYREVIRRAPHEFKIACLEDIKALFPSDCSPFYAGFGNRDTDEISYLKVGIPKGKIFIINPKGEVVVNRRVDSKSYSSLHALVHDMFPPPASFEQLQEDYNSWNFWKLPPPLIDM